MKIQNFSQARQLLYQQIPASLEQIFTASLGLKRTKYFLKLLGEPQNKLKTVHIAGTSGKGSTAYLISIILKSFGFKTGLTISPHLLDVRERVQINNQPLSKQKFIYYLNKLLPYINKMKLTRFGPPTYFEILTSLAFYTFWKEKVDYAVIETGLGGLYDATNAINNQGKLAILTRIGLDHTWILGRTLKAITFQKASIIQRGNIVISLWQKPSVRRMIKEMAKKKKARLFLVKKNFKTPFSYLNSPVAGFSKVGLSPKKTRFNFHFSDLEIRNIELGLIGLHQAENCSLALVAVLALSKRENFQFSLRKVKQALKQAHFPGRLEIIKLKGKTLIIDGAHNPQKMMSLTKSLRKLWPQKKFNFLVAIKKGKNHFKMLEYVVPLANRIIVTSFFVSGQDLVHRSESPEKLKEALQKLGFKDYKIIAVPEDALESCLLLNQNYLVVTGSLYLVAEIYPLLKN